MSVPIESTTGGRSSLYRRAPVRLIVFFVVLFGADLCGHPTLVWAYHHSPARVADWAALGASIVLALVLIGVYAALVRGLERRTATELAPGAGRALAGVALGVALFTVVLALIHAAGAAHLQGISAHYAPIPVLSASLLGAVGEELAFRGGVFRILEDSCGTTVALTLSAAIFGLMHTLNPGATLLSAVAIAIEAGVLLGAAYALTRNLWLPIGLHFGWNFANGGIFGLATSSSASKAIFDVTIAGPRLLTGGALRPDASVIAVAVCSTAAFVLILFTIRGHRWKRAPTGLSRRTGGR